jgi:membrane fusion protein, multidrug efflux system
MKPSRWCVAAWVALPLAATLFGGCAKPIPTIQAAPPEVTVCQPLTRVVTDYFPSFSGHTESVESVEVRAQVSGYIVDIRFRDGQDVKKGDLLVQIDDRPYRAALDRAIADVARQHALLAKARADLARADKLMPTRAISQEEYDQTAAQKAVAEANLLSAEAGQRDAQVNLDFTRVIAPIDGRVSRALVTKGNLVGAGATGSTVLTTIKSENPIYAYFDVDENTVLRSQTYARQGNQPTDPADVRDLKIPVEMGLANDEGFPRQGILDFVDNKFDTGTGTIRCRGVFDNSDHSLTAGLFIHVRVPFGKPHEALLLSPRAVANDREKKYVLVVDQVSIAQYRQVQVGAQHGDLVVIVSGLHANDNVVVNGLRGVRPGTKVAARPGPMPGVTPGPAPTGKDKPKESAAPAAQKG